MKSREKLASALSVLVALAAATVLSGCINQAGNADPYRVFGVSEAQLNTARSNGRPYVVNRRGHLQAIEPIDFNTSQLGRIRLLPNYVSDGSSRPFDDDPGSDMAAILHDALYRGAPQLTFPDGFQGRWTRKQADAIFCEQLRIQKATNTNAFLNCKGVNVFYVSQGVWMLHRKKREAYWQTQAEILRKKRRRQLFITPG